METRRIAEGREIASVVFDEERIAERIAELGGEIAEHYSSGELVLLGLLKGSFVFLADLVRRIPRPFQVDFLMAASYGSSTKSSGDVRLLYEPDTKLEGKHVLLVEDIVDSGNTLSRVIHLLRQRKPRSLEICTLLHKRIANALTLEPRFVGFDAPAMFLVGYGLDHAEDFRHLPFIASIED
jgi:hypoxanthine phosphoribosyltransferase